MSRVHRPRAARGDDFGELPATAGITIFAQSPHLRNGQIGSARGPCLGSSDFVDASFLLLKKASSESPITTSRWIRGIFIGNTTLIQVLKLAEGADAMRRALPLLLVFSCLTFAQSISKAQGDETKIIALENLWNHMQLNHDAEAMGKLLDDDFVFTDYDGTVMSKPQFLESIRDKSYQLSVEASENMKLYRHGDTVVVIGATHEKGTFKGKPYQHLGRFTDTWMKKNGQWLCVASHLGVIRK
jgi:ketosteroid isomerase-like protein